jgi:hypothetical protein
MLLLSLLEKFQKLLALESSRFYILLVQHELAAQEGHGDAGGQERGCQGASGARPQPRRT